MKLLDANANANPQKSGGDKKKIKKQTCKPNDNPVKT